MVIEKFNIFAKWNNFKEKQNIVIKVILEIIEFIILLNILAIIIHQGLFQRRFIPTKSMLPYLQPGDQLIVEKISLNLKKLGIGKGLKRGDVVVFYPPFVELNKNILNRYVRLTGFSGEIQLGPIKPFFFMPTAEEAYIKRIVAMPGETVEIKEGDGIYINGERLNEFYPPSLDGQDFVINEYPFEAPRYSMKYLTDISDLSPEFRGSGPVVVPEGHYFCLGDNRNDSRDGHVWGFVPKNRVIGKAYALIWRNLRLYKPETITEKKNRIFKNF